MVLLEKLRSYKDKQQLCEKIENRYMEAHHKHIDTATDLFLFIEELSYHDQKGRVQEEYKSVLPAIYTISQIGFLGAIQEASRYIDEAARYSWLSKSIELLFVRHSKLETVLESEQLPIGKKPFYSWIVNP